MRSALALLLLASLVGFAAGCSKPSAEPAATRADPPAIASPTLTLGGLETRTWRAPGEGKHPAVLLVHGAGGPKIFGDAASNHHVVPERIAARGYDVFMPDYRSASDPLAKLGEVLTKIAEEPRVDASRLGLLGFSRGAHYALLLAASDARVKALVEVYGWLSPEESAAMKRMPPTLILHGERDTDVVVLRAHDLERLFTERGVPFESHIYPKEGHGFNEPALSDSIERTLTFLEGRLAR